MNPLTPMMKNEERRKPMKPLTYSLILLLSIWTALMGTIIWEKEW